MGVKDKIITGTKVVVGAAPGLVTGDWKTTVATAIANTLLVAADAFSDMSQKRAQELFDRPEFAEHVVAEIKKSDDFASFAFDLWRRYNYESSENRRLLLKTVLEHATYEEERDYENFSKIFLVTQQITGAELIVLKAFYMPDVYRYAENGSAQDYNLNVSQLDRLFRDKQIAGEDVLPELAQALTQLANYGLISERPATLGGPFYGPLRFGKIFLGYIDS